ncbi:S8 family peptidase [Haladaptatus sp. CMSO5]|uniref:S8 family peptidase n=1 Tax=Haladaptatus sp. CMSO5 TaxID=3120514 RepID=UPI002FCE2918
MGDKLPLGRRRFLKATGSAALLASVGQVAAQGPNNGRRRGPKENEVLVGVSNGAPDHREAVEKHVPAHAAAVHDCSCLRYVAVKFNDNASDQAKENFKKRIRKKEYIKYAEDNATLSAQYTPNDTRYGDQYADQMVNAPTAWDTTLGSSSITVAVVDQGVKYDHPDLDGNMDASVSNYGSDFVDNDGDPYPDVLADEYHGTHVAGIAAGEVDNGEGVSGIGNSSILSARALSEEGTGSTSDIADAIVWAADNGADVINLSLGGGGYTQTMKDAISYAYNTQGVFIAAAAGNDGAGSVSYPAAYAECLAVSALDPDGSLASYSNYGSNLELAAPGTNVLSTWTDDGYNKISGTSMATPVVAGVAGLTLAKWSVSASELRTHLKNTAVDVGLSSNQQGSGRVDAGNAVTTDPADGGSGGGGSGDTDTTTVNDSLSSSSDADCWSYAWSYSAPSEVEITLSGPSSADFDLYVSDGTGACPTTYSYDYYSYSANSEEAVIITNPDVSTDLHILVDSYSGSGSYDLTITETQ